MTKETLIRKLKKVNACEEGIEWLEAQKETDFKKLVKLAMKENLFSWVNWAIVRLMTYKQYVSYACYAAKQVLGIFEKEYPDDKRPREAINAALKCIKKPTKKNKTDAANAAANAAAYDAANTAANAAAYDAANAAANVAANDAANAANAAANAAAYDAAYAAYATDAAYDAAAVADAAYAHKKLQAKIVNYGMRLLK